MMRQPPARAAGRAYSWSLLLVVGSTGIALFGREAFHLPDVVMLYLLAIMATSFRFGRGPSLFAAGLSVAAYDFFFVPPFHTLDVEHARHVLTFGMMFGLGLVISTLTSRLRLQEREALVREERTAALYALSRELVGVPDAARAAAIAARHAAIVSGGEAAVLLRQAGGDLTVGGLSRDDVHLGPEDLGAARWACDNAREAGAETGILSGAGVSCIPLTAGLVPLGVLALRRPAPAATDAADRGFLDAFARQISFALERVRLRDEAQAADLRARGEELRSSLLSAVSHDLRTPLAAITGAGTTLRDELDRLGPDQRRELVDTICTEAERMERLVGNILDMVRLEGGGPVIAREWVPLEEVLGSALLRLESRLQGREVRTDLPEGLPLIPVDPVLFEQVFVNLLDNAARHTPQGTPVEVGARVTDQALEVVVADRGPGFTPGDEGRLFEKFHRGAGAGRGGVGLGLAICRAIVQAHGGRIDAENRAGGGALLRIRLPLRETPPTVTAEVPGEAPP
jgi:two-component system sensor histidine kinase KdpD